MFPKLYRVVVDKDASAASFQVVDVLIILTFVSLPKIGNWKLWIVSSICCTLTFLKAKLKSNLHGG